MYFSFHIYTYVYVYVVSMYVWINMKLWYITIYLLCNGYVSMYVGYVKILVMFGLWMSRLFPVSVLNSGIRRISSGVCFRRTSFWRDTWRVKLSRRLNFSWSFFLFPSLCSLSEYYDLRKLMFLFIFFYALIWNDTIL